MHMQPW